MITLGAIIRHTLYNRSLDNKYYKTNYDKTIC